MPPPFFFGLWGDARGSSAKRAAVAEEPRTVFRSRSAVLIVSAVLSMGAVSAHAEDFTGFYAGVNAGYGFERGHRDAASGPVSLPGDTGGRADPELPPSARSAADSSAMHGTRTTPRR
jgi:hypothetical protein